MSKQIYDAVIQSFIDSKAMSLIKENYFFLHNDEMKEIKNVVGSVLLEEKDVEKHINLSYYNEKKSQLEKIITEQIDGQEITNIRGFITFRMKHFQNILEDMLDKIVEFYMVEKEYNEFIKLLKYFIDIQECMVETLVIKFDDEGYLIEDKDGNDITDEITKDLKDLPILAEDKLISALITASPRKITLEHPVKCKSEELLDTIKRVFENKIEIIE